MRIQRRFNFAKSSFWISQIPNKHDLKRSKIMTLGILTIKHFKRLSRLSNQNRFWNFNNFKTNWCETTCHWSIKTEIDPKQWLLQRRLFKNAISCQNASLNNFQNPRLKIEQWWNLYWQYLYQIQWPGLQFS